MKKILSLLLVTTVSCSVFADLVVRPPLGPKVEPKHVAPTFKPTVPHAITNPGDTVQPKCGIEGCQKTPKHVAPTFKPTVPHSVTTKEN